MALVSSNQFQLAPQLDRLAGGFQQGQQIAANRANMAAHKQAGEASQQAQALSGKALSGEPGALQEVASLDPQRALQIQSFLSGQGEEERNEGARENEALTRTAINALSLPTQDRRAFLEQKSAEFKADGRDTSNLDRVLSGDDSSLDQSLTMQAREGQQIEDVFKTQFPQQQTASPATELGLATLEQRKTEQEFKEEQAEIKQSELKPTVQKILDSAQTEAIDAGQRSRSLSVLADDISKMDVGGGLASTVSESMKAVLGSQDEVSNLRRRFRAVRASQATQNLPPGPASDKDIALALSGFPKENASGAEIVSFLRGAAKLENVNAAFQTFKADLISQQGNTKGMLKTWKSKKQSEALGRPVSMSELFITSQQSGMSIEELEQKLGI